MAPSSRATLLALALGAALAAPSLAAPDELSEADLAEVFDGECDADDDQCAVSMRQLRAGVLAPEGVESALQKRREAPVEAEGVSFSEYTAGMGPVALSQTLLGKSGVYTVYHQTSIGICLAIAKGEFRPGKRGWCGGAIYFADTMRGTFGEAVGPESHQGCVIRAKVQMGKIKEMPPTCDAHMTGAKLKAMGYDSIRFNDGAGTGEQYVIYDPKQVLSKTVVWMDRDHQMKFNNDFNITDNGSDTLGEGDNDDQGN